MKDIKLIISIFLVYLLFLISCNSGASEDTQKQIQQELKEWDTNKKELQNLENEVINLDTFFNKLITDTLGEQGIKFIEKDSLSRERIKSLKNDYQNLKMDYTNLLANYTTLLKETEDWSKKITQSTQSTDEINEEWESKQRQIQEILSQKEAYEQAINALKQNFIQAVIEIKNKMNKK